MIKCYFCVRYKMIGGTMEITQQVELSSLPLPGSRVMFDTYLDVILSNGKDWIWYYPQGYVRIIGEADSGYSAKQAARRMKELWGNGWVYDLLLCSGKQDWFVHERLQKLYGHERLQAE